MNFKPTRTISIVILSILLGMNTNLFADDTGGYGGRWTNKGYDIDGTWKIVQKADKTVLVLDENFKTRKGPDLKIFLSKIALKDIKGSKVKYSSVLVSPLKSPKGAQEYEIPADISLEDYASVLIHCEAYAHLWGGATLEQ